MADKLNYARLRNTKTLIALTVLIGVFGNTLFPDDSFPHEAMDLLGYILVTACAIGRIYSTAFIGGAKSKELVTSGPYSIVRNPLYFFSFLGATGIGLMSTSFLALAIIVFGFLFIYLSVIRREEASLRGKFGKTFDDYKARVPRFVPSFKNYTCPEELTFQPKFLTKAVWDAVWWFAPYPIFELAEYLREINVIDPIVGDSENRGHAAGAPGAARVSSLKSAHRQGLR